MESVAWLSKQETNLNAHRIFDSAKKDLIPYLTKMLENHNAVKIQLELFDLYSKPSKIMVMMLLITIKCRKMLKPSNQLRK